MIEPTLVRALQKATKITALTGAGVSAESDIPTFREAQTGLWARYDPMELATPQAFKNNPELVWRWYAWRKNLISSTKPNPAHKALSKLESQHRSFTLITQNVDNLHQQSGSKNVIELHGNIFRIRCSRENHYVTSWNDSIAIAPTCPVCHAHLRPDVVWFTEMLPRQALERAVEHASKSNLFLIIGTSALVQPAASLPLIARQNGATLVEINPQSTPLSNVVDFSLRGAAGTIMPEIAKHILTKTR